MSQSTGTSRGRPEATTTASSETVEFQEGLARAHALEQQLTAAQGKDPRSSKASSRSTKQIRFSLCEVLSHLILLNPALAATERLPDRLWSTCFYDRCKQATNTLAAAAARRRKQEAAGNAGATGKPTIITPEWEASWKSFVEQSITLYSYLVDAMQAKLVDGYRLSRRSRPQNRDDHDDDSMESSHGFAEENEDGMDKENGMRTTSSATRRASNPQTTVKTTEGIIPCLTRLFIHLGDLYRYSSNIAKAEASYQQSALLAPGHGNAFNQLAVLTHQHSDHYCVALYYYLRALAATTDAFGPAAGNLQRLFKDNAKVLALLVEQQEEEERQHELHTTMEQTGRSSLRNMSKGQLSKRFLTELVAVHRDIATVTAAAASSEAPLQELKERSIRVIELFNELLKQSLLGEGLLLKIVCVQAQAECAVEKNMPKDLIECLSPVIHSLTSQLADSLADRVFVSIKKHLDQQKKVVSGTQSSFKGLLPLMLLTEYLYESQLDLVPLQRPDIDGSARPTLDQSSEEFWMKTIELMNLLKDLSGLLGWKVSGSDKPLQRKAFKAYQSFRGFGPFQNFLSRLDDGYVTAGEALDLLQLHDATAGLSSQASLQTNNSRSTTQQQISTQDTTSAKTIRSHGSVGNASSQILEEVEAKVARYLLLGNKLVMDSHSLVGQRVERNVLNDRLTWHRLEEPMEEDLVDDGDQGVAMDETEAEAHHAPETIFMNTPVVDEDDAGDFINESATLVYKTDMSGGVPLLVPDALTKAQVDPIASPVLLDHRTGTGTPSTGTSNVDTVNQRDAANPECPASSISTLPLRPTTTMAPPPGFAAVTHQAEPRNDGYSAQLLFPASHRSLANDNPPLTYLFESPALFGDIASYRTVNPFADVTGVPFGNDNILAPPNSDGLNDLLMNEDDTAYLGKGLLRSILSDDSPKKTKNPFA